MTNEDQQNDYGQSNADETQSKGGSASKQSENQQSQDQENQGSSFDTGLEEDAA